MPIILCPYCSQNISDKALVCQSCNGSLGIGSYSAIRQALISDPSLIGQDPSTKERLRILVQSIDQSMRDAKIAEENKKIIEEQKRLAEINLQNDNLKKEKALKLSKMPKWKRIFVTKWHLILVLFGLVVSLIYFINFSIEQSAIREAKKAAQEEMYAQYKQSADNLKLNYPEVLPIIQEYCSVSKEFLTSDTASVVREWTKPEDFVMSNSENSVWWLYIEHLYSLETIYKKYYSVLPLENFQFNPPYTFYSDYGFSGFEFSETFRTLAKEPISHTKVPNEQATEDILVNCSYYN